MVAVYPLKHFGFPLQRSRRAETDFMPPCTHVPRVRYITRLEPLFLWQQIVSFAPALLYGESLVGFHQNTGYLVLLPIGIR